jgi:putative ABC transport system substrate-binding protein
MGDVGRRRFLILSAGLSFAPRLVRAQSASKVYRIAYLSAGDRGRFSAAFLEGLHDLGWEEGRNFVIDGRWAEGEHEKLPEMARDLVRREPDIVVSITTPATRAAVAVSRSTPVVFTMVADPVGSGFVDSLAHPGGSVTGLSFVPELSFFGK